MYHVPLWLFLDKVTIHPKMFLYDHHNPATFFPLALGKDFFMVLIKHKFASNQAFCVDQTGIQTLCRLVSSYSGPYLLHDPT